MRWPMKTAGPHGERGAALLVVLFAVSALTLMGLAMLGSSMAWSG